MNTNRRCGCKSFNSCYLCEAEFGLSGTEPAFERLQNSHDIRVFCPECQCLFKAGPRSPTHICPGGGCQAVASNQRFFGLEIIRDFISLDEEAKLIHDLDTTLPWDTSQSGRRKQNFGPKTNFKKRKVKLGSFNGFPAVTKFVQDRFMAIPTLDGYRTVEQCSIEYRPETGARIDPHIDDCWVWGERIVQLNLLSDSVLTLFKYKGDPHRYNLPDVRTYPKLMDKDKVAWCPFKDSWASVTFTPYEFLTKQDDTTARNDTSEEDFVVRVPLPRRSLLIMYGEPRYDWEHCILRGDIKSRRIVVAYREFTPTYLPKGGPEAAIGQEILDKALNFF